LLQLLQLLMATTDWIGNSNSMLAMWGMCLTSLKQMHLAVQLGIEKVLDSLAPEESRPCRLYVRRVLTA
jgi:hypothetical protein